MVLFSSVLGVVLQSIETKARLLEPLEVIRQLFGRLNRLVARLIPLGIFALTALNVARLDGSQLLKIQGFFQLSMLALVLLIALPLLVENLRRELPAVLDPADRHPQAAAELAPLVSLGFALPTLGQVAALWFIPFAAWYVDQPLTAAQSARMLLTAIPAAVSGLKAVIREELQSRGLPLDLLQLIYINGEWLYRFEKVLAFEGLVVLAVLVYARAVGKIHLRPLRVLGTLVLAGLLALAGGRLGQAQLARSLEGSYRNDQTLLALRAIDQSVQPLPIRQLMPQPVSLAAILKRGVLRVGVCSDGMPWAYRNSRGELVGFDIDLVKALARSFGVSLEVRQTGLADLETWLDAE